MKPAQLVQHLARELPDLRWLSEPILPSGVVAIATAKIEGKTIEVSLSQAEKLTVVFTRADGSEWTRWTDGRSLKAVLPVLKKHVQWFLSDTPKPSALHRPKR